MTVRRVESLRHVARHSVGIMGAATVLFAAASVVAGLSPYLLAALALPLAEYFACYRLGIGERGIRPVEAKFFTLCVHAICLTFLLAQRQQPAEYLAACLQYVSLSLLGMGIGAFVFKSRILAFDAAAGSASN